MKTYSPRFITETDQPAPWQDCTWASTLMLANKASLGKYPATRAERRALREASGDHLGGSNRHDAARGIKERYGWDLTEFDPSFHTLLLRLAGGEGFLANGLYSRLSPHFTRWDRNFAAKGDLSTHATYVQGHDRGGNYHTDSAGALKDVFWCDPLGRSTPGTPPKDRYRGEWLPVHELRAFLMGLGNNDAVLGATVKQGSVT